MKSCGPTWRRGKPRVLAEIQKLRNEKRKLWAEIRRLRSENQSLRDEKATLAAQKAALQQQVAELQAKLREAERHAKRQAAPFSKGKPRAEPRKRGRKAGAHYGRKGHRPPPPPDRIDEVHEARLPDRCPYCGGTIAEEKDVVLQFQTEIPRRPIVRQFNIHQGTCNGCGRNLQGTHPLQTSDATGAAASQLGADAQAAVAYLNKYGGVSYGKIARFFAVLFGIALTPGGAAQIVRRVGRRCQPAYQQIQAAVRRSPWVVLDETGWRVGGRDAWLHVQVGERATSFVIARGRGADVAAGVLGRDYAGTLIHDGWSPYDTFRQARHQQCVQHVLRRARRMLETAVGGAVHFPRQVIAILEAALRERNEYEAGRRTADELAESALALACQLETLTERPKSNAENQRLAKHLRKHIWAWFWFLLEPGLDATNWRGEQALRLGVTNRKVWGGNRDETGRISQGILMSVIATCVRHGICPLTFLSRAMRTWCAQLIPP
jgi:transposase